MSELKVFVTRRRVPDAIELLKGHFDVEVWDETTPPPRDVVLEKLNECQGILTEIDDIMDAEVLGAAQALKIIANRAVGLDNVDVEAATRHGILVSNTPGVLHESCADFTFGLILSAARKITYGDRQIRAGKWTVFDQMPYLGTDVYGSTLGIIGLGPIGLAVARRAAGFDMKVIYYSRTRKPEHENTYGIEWRPDLPSLLRESDYVSVSVALTPETEYIIGEKELSMMKSEAFLINASRGRTVDPKALYNALLSGTIAGAALDVTDPEPIPFDDPLLSLDNVVFTPHIASASAATLRRMGMLAAENIIAALNGKPMPSPVNPEVLT